MTREKSGVTHSRANSSMSSRLPKRKLPMVDKIEPKSMAPEASVVYARL